MGERVSRQKRDRERERASEKEGERERLPVTVYIHSWKCILPLKRVQPPFCFRYACFCGLSILYLNTCIVYSVYCIQSIACETHRERERKGEKSTESDGREKHDRESADRESDDRESDDRETDDRESDDRERKRNKEK